MQRQQVRLHEDEDSIYCASEKQRNSEGQSGHNGDHASITLQNNDRVTSPNACRQEIDE